MQFSKASKTIFFGGPMSSVNDYIRSFGMSGMLIEAELKGVEEKFSLDLGLSSKVIDVGPVEYYPQFEQRVRAEAAEMARHYELFYCLEKAIRKLISET